MFSNTLLTKILSRTSTFVPAIIIGLPVMLWGAIYNGYPLVYSDTSTYLASGFEFQTPFDRPITYGLFLWIFSLGGYSLWLPIVVQALFLSGLLMLTVRQFLPRTDIWSNTAILAVTALFSGVSFVSGQLITDVFTPIGALLIWHIVQNPEIKKSRLVLFYLLLLLSSAMHLSHLALFAGLSLVTILFPCFGLSFKKRAARGGMAVVVSLLAIGAMGAALGKSKHVFFMARMADSGLLQEILQNECHNHEFGLCAWKDSLPQDANYFLWNRQSPLNRMGSWKSAKEEFETIIGLSFSKPRYVLKHLKYAGTATMRQLLTFRVGDGNGAFNSATLLNKRIAQYVPRDHRQFNNSLQQSGSLNADRLLWLNRFYGGVVLLSILVILFFCFRSVSKPKFRFLTGFSVYVLFVLTANAAVNASLVMVADRFQAKVVWFLPFLAILSYFVYRRQQI